MSDQILFTVIVFLYCVLICYQHYIITQLKKETELLKRKLDIAKQTLEFYANKNHWNESLPDIKNWYLIETTDRGNYARKVLLDIEVLK